MEVFQCSAAGSLCFEAGFQTAASRQTRQQSKPPFGFQLVPDFSGTAHSYVGHTLKAASADCLAWDTTATRDHMLRAYCTMSRTCTAKTLLVMQPFAPMLFRQGELPGPHLMMEFWHGRLAAADVEAAWKTAEAAQAKTKNRWEDVLWTCSICKKELDSLH